jgi:hypothetical protein
VRQRELARERWAVDHLAALAMVRARSLRNQAIETRTRSIIITGCLAAGVGGSHRRNLCEFQAGAASARGEIREG